MVCNVDFDFVQEQPRLRESPLKTVLAQMRFPAQIGFGEGLARPIQRKLASQYPRAEIGTVAEVRLDATGVAPLATEPIFHLRDADGAWTVALSRSFISLETEAYVDFADFIRRWFDIVSVVADHLEIDRQERIGLRYVNELRMQPEPSVDELGALLRPELVGIVGAHPSTQRLRGSMQELRFAVDGGTGVLRHGLIPRERDAAYVVDLDFYDDMPSSLDAAAQARLMGRFNHQMFDLFRWLWKPEQFAKFAPEEG